MQNTQSRMSMIALATCYALMGTVVGPVGAMAGECVTIPGSLDLLLPGTIVLLGEVHGTNESPRALTEQVH